MGSRASVSCLSISPCTKLVTSGQKDNTIVLWDTSTRCRKHMLFGHTGSVTCTDVDAHKVVSGSNDRTVKVGKTYMYQYCKTAIKHGGAIKLWAFWGGSF